MHRLGPSCTSLALLVAALAAPTLSVLAQQPDSAAVRDSIARADSARADSVLRSELARITLSRTVALSCCACSGAVATMASTVTATTRIIRETSGIVTGWSVHATCRVAPR